MSRAVALALRRLPGPTPATQPPLVIAHGLLGSGRNWGALAARFAERRETVVVDMRNHGDSPWTRVMSYEEMAEDLLELIRREAGGRAALLGHSMGGKAAMAAALLRPSAVAALVVADIAPIAYPPGAPSHAHGATLAALAALDLGSITRRADADAALAGALPDAAFRGFLLQNLALEPDADGRVRARWRPNLDTLTRAMPDLVGWPEALGARIYDGAALFVAGARSDYLDAAGRARAARLFPNAAFHTLDAGHWLHAEQPDAFHRAVDDWLTLATTP